MFKTIWGSLAVTALAAGFGSAAYAADADVIREAKDRAEIEQLIWRYTHALDTLDEETYAATYTEDGEFCCEQEVVSKGREALRKIVTDVKKSRAESEAKTGSPAPKMYHIITNSHIEFVSKDHAHIDSYWMTVFADKPPNGSPRVALVGRCEDEVVRVNGKWLIRSRNVFPQD